MIEFSLRSENKICFTVNNELYNDTVIFKVLYWLSGIYIISSDKKDNYIEITLEKGSEYNSEEVQNLKFKISQDLIDFKVRDIINIETKNIRELLLIKAFANNDEFDDYNIILEENINQI